MNIPKLAEGVVIVPGSAAFLFNLNVAGHANNTLVNNVGRNLVTSLKVKFGGEILQDTQLYDLLQTYNDLFLSKEEREDRLKQGISYVNMRKLRTNAGDKVTSDTGEVALASVHNTKYRIPLDHPVLNDHEVFYPKALPNHLIFELTFAQVADIVIYSDVTRLPIIQSRIWSWSINASQVTAWQSRRELLTNLEKSSSMKIYYYIRYSPSPNRMTASSMSTSIYRGDP